MLIVLTSKEISEVLNQHIKKMLKDDNIKVTHSATGDISFNIKKDEFNSHTNIRECELKL